MNEDVLVLGVRRGTNFQHTRTMNVNGAWLQKGRAASFRMVDSRARDCLISIVISNGFLVFLNCADYLSQLFNSMVAIAAIESDILPKICVTWRWLASHHATAVVRASIRSLLMYATIIFALISVTGEILLTVERCPSVVHYLELWLPSNICISWMASVFMLHCTVAMMRRLLVEVVITW